MSTSPYPVHVGAELDTGLTRWLWLVKWLLAIPHFIVLAFLWLAFVVLSVVAMVAIVVTGRYPRGIFDFNVGVLRWTWRVAYYAYGALGTDKYPPFSLAERADYPAHLVVDYPEHLSRGLALVKWWLLAIPQYLVVGFFVGGGVWFGDQAGQDSWPGAGWGGGLIGLLVLVAAVVLAFTGRYPQPIFDFVLGLNRWVLRVAAYAALMTDVYPPFRLDLGGDEPDAARWSLGPQGFPDPATPQPSTAGPTPTTGSTPASTWSAGRIVSVIVSSCLLLLAAGLGTAGTAVLVADRQLRQDGYLMSGEHRVSSAGYALTSDTLRLDRGSPSDAVPERFLGRVRVTVTPAAGTAVFVGIAAATDAARYLRGVEHTTVTELRPTTEGGPRYRESTGGAPTQPPGQVDIWAASAAGPGPRSIDWAPRDGDWVMVVMNADGSRPVRADVSAGAQLPALSIAARVVLVLATLGLLVGGAGLALSLHRSSGRVRSDGSTAGATP